MTPLVNRIAELLYPLSDFYAASGARLPDVETVDGLKMPQPFRRLLVHRNDMTPTLEAFAGQRIGLRTLEVHRGEDALYRQVVLITDGDEQPMEFGAIKIYVDRFEAEAREKILGCRCPLGTILHDYKIKHASRPTDFFSMTSDPVIAGALGLEDAERTLYGRHNVLWDAENMPLAEVVEVLPPFDDRPNAQENGDG
ncbi:MAG: hypothetical protein WD294_09665 [Phycisphaeraceae bacterium]